MKCPIDGEVLKAEKAEAHTGYGCPKCKGSWLPKKYIDSLQYTKEFEPQQFWKELTSKSIKNNDFKCPSNCGTLYSIDDLEGISYCPSCFGMWFNPSALKSMLKTYPNKTEPVAVVDAPNAIIGFLGILGALFK